MNKPLLICLAALLLTIKFVVLPVMDWQSSTLSTLEQKRERLYKTQETIDNIDVYSQQLKSLQATQSTLAETFYPLTPELKITVQQSIENTLNEHSLVLENFNWVLEQDDALSQFIFDISMTGALEDFIAFSYTLAQQTPRMYVQNISIRRNNSTRRSINTDKVSAKMVVLFIASANYTQQDKQQNTTSVEQTEI